MKTAFLLILFFELADCKHRELKLGSHTYVTDPKYLNCTMEKLNATYLGAIRIWVLARLPTISVSFFSIVISFENIFLCVLQLNVIIKIDGKSNTFLDHTMPLCNVRDQQNINLFVQYFIKINEKNTNFRINDLRCPIQKVCL